MNWSKYKKSLEKTFRRLRCRLLGGQRILVLGDSHAGVFEYIFDHDLWPPHLINCDIVGGATAHGLNNDHSVTRAFEKYQDALRRFPDYGTVLIMLGEVDCSFALWHRASQKGESAAMQIPQALSGVERLLDLLAADKRRHTVALVGAILPTIKDHQIDQQAFELRRKIKATQRQRSALVLAFNQALGELAVRRGLPYVDITSVTIDPELGVVRDEFLVEAGIDHHQSQKRTAPLWVEALQCLLHRETGRP